MNGIQFINHNIVGYANARLFYNEIKKWSIANKNQAWGQWEGQVAGKHVRLKTWGRSYPQIFDVDGVRWGGQGDMKPKAFQELLYKALEYNDG